ncbi:shikimate kinase [Chloroflexota bacterium]
MKSNIALIGFMGVGKTETGKVLAGRLGKRFVETDALIEKRAGKPIPEIFRGDGEITFRELEIEVLREVAGGGNQVIACGGGVVLNKINIDRLKKDSAVVCLTASPEVILKRITGGDRPLLAVADPALAIRELLGFRQPLYERAADIKIDTSEMDIDFVVAEIVSRVKQDEGLS